VYFYISNFLFFQKAYYVGKGLESYLIVKIYVADTILIFNIVSAIYKSKFFINAIKLQLHFFDKKIKKIFFLFYMNIFADKKYNICLETMI